MNDGKPQSNQEIKPEWVNVDNPPTPDTPNIPSIPQIHEVPTKKKDISLKIIISLVLVSLGAFGVLAYQKYFSPKQITTPQTSPAGNVCTMEAKICPDGTSVGRVGPNCEFAPCPDFPISEKGTVSGKLCYPSSFLPPGEIVAKDLSSGKTYTQDYAGSGAGGKSTYTFELPIGTYHIRYQAHASTDKPDIFTSGYYDECAKTMATNECTPDSGHILGEIKVSSGTEINNIDLCDFYYNQTQMESLDKSF